MTDKRITSLFFDLDGTLLDDAKSIDPELIAYLWDLKQRRGLRLGFATGRHEVSVSPIIERFQLDGLLDFMVCNNGADLYYFDTGEHITNGYIPVETLDHCLSLFGKYDFIASAFHNDGHKLIANRYTKAVEGVLTRNAYNKFYYPNETDYCPASKFLVLFDPADFDRVDAAVKANPVDGLRSVRTEDDIYELISLENSKAAGTAKVLARYGWTMENVMFFGDAENDRQMMEHSGISVCMANGKDFIKPIADFITSKSNNENGIQDFLETHEFLL